MEKCSWILAILQEHRVETATKVQSVLTNFGCNIRLRLGLHDAGIGECAPSGLILLQACGEKAEIDNLQKELQSIPTVKVKVMSLDF